MHFKERDEVSLVDLQDGGFRITPLNERFAGQMAMAEDIMREDREVLRELAKK